MTTQYIQKGNYEATELDGEWIILNTDQYTITKLNDEGGHCWSLLTEVQTVDSLTQSLLAKFATIENELQVKKDMEDFLANLVQCGLIEHVD
ncbi:PqqD family protein [Bacillus sp. AFS073361]|uniref:PqqD family protein n=1 Tax=Bacillus sp. AFS073361 TaxID=2033511 RepID=UPI000BF4C761|nr:PqqD family protein [Bacillus sp. AFS073361]PFP29511.1 PqqD family protein [Bacillus sp. AFS073361]